MTTEEKAKEYAEQLRLLSETYLQDIKAEDFRSKEQGSLKSYIDMSNQLTFKVIADILSPKNKSGMQKQYDFYMTVLKECLDSHDYHSGAAIFTALSNSAVERVCQDKVSISGIGDNEKVMLESTNNGFLALSEEGKNVLLKAGDIFNPKNNLGNVAKEQLVALQSDISHIPNATNALALIDKVNEMAKDQQEGAFQAAINSFTVMKKKAKSENLARLNPATADILMRTPILKSEDYYKRSLAILPRGGEYTSKGKWKDVEIPKAKKSIRSFLKESFQLARSRVVGNNTHAKISAKDSIDGKSPIDALNNTSFKLDKETIPVPPIQVDSVNKSPPPIPPKPASLAKRNPPPIPPKPASLAKRNPPPIPPKPNSLSASFMPGLAAHKWKNAQAPLSQKVNQIKDNVLSNIDMLDKLGEQYSEREGKLEAIVDYIKSNLKEAVNIEATIARLESEILPSTSISTIKKDNNISFDEALKSVFNDMREPPKAEQKEDSKVKLGGNRGG